MRWAFLAAAVALAGCTPGGATPGDPGVLAPGRVAAPARLTIPTLGLDARIAPVGLGPDGAMAAPGTPDEVAWYADGARPGERGNAVLAGHNVRDGRVGAFAGLARLRAGDRVVVTTSMQGRFPYVVEWARRYPSAGAPLGEIVGPTDEPALTLVTGAGARGPSGEYDERLVVRARGLVG